MSDLNIICCSFMKTESDWYEKQDPYPYVLINDESNEIRGSCRHYNTRTNVTDHIKDQDHVAKISLKQAIERYIILDSGFEIQISYFILKQ